MYTSSRWNRPCRAGDPNPTQIDQRVQHELAVAEIDALGHTGGTGGVEHCRAGVLVEIANV